MNSEERVEVKFSNENIQELLDNASMELCALLFQETKLVKSVATRNCTEKIELIRAEIEALEASIKNYKKMLVLMPSKSKGQSEDGDEKTYAPPKDLPIFNTTVNAENPMDVSDFLEVYEVRMETSGIPPSNWARLFTASVPHSDIPTLRWVRSNIC